MKLIPKMIKFIFGIAIVTAVVSCQNDDLLEDTNINPHRSSRSDGVIWFAGEHTSMNDILNDPILGNSFDDLIQRQSMVVRVDLLQMM